MTLIHKPRLHHLPSPSFLLLALSHWSHTNSKHYFLFLPPQIIFSLYHSILSHHRSLLHYYFHFPILQDIQCALSWDSWRCSPYYKNKTKRAISRSLRIRYRERAFNLQPARNKHILRSHLLFLPR